MMVRSIICWVAAILITIGSGIYQRRTGPSYPLEGKINFGGREISYHFERSHAGPTDCPINVTTNDSTINATLEWRYYKSEEDYIEVPMKYSNGKVSAVLPHQPPAGKLEYRIQLSNGVESAYLPENMPVIIRFRGEVPVVIVVVHIIAMFIGMLFSNRGGLEAITGNQNLLRYVKWTIIFLALGGLIFGPIMQWYAFGEFWTGWPFGNDLTDNKTAVAILAWLFALFALKKFKNPRRVILAAAIITLIVYLIPHSVLGSELDYSKKKNETTVYLMENRNNN